MEGSIESRRVKRGRAPSPPEVLRSEAIRLMVTPGELADIDEIAVGWGVPRATAAWALMLTELQRARSRDMVVAAKLTLPLSVAVDTLRQAGWLVKRRGPE